MNPQDSFIGEFVAEARERLQALNEALLEFERAGNDEARGTAIKEAMRQAHTLKGAAAMLGFSDMSQIAHCLEDLFVLAGRQADVMEGDALDLVFRTLDLLSARVDQLAAGGTQTTDFSTAAQALAAKVAASTSAGASSGGPKAPPEPVRVPAEKASPAPPQPTTGAEPRPAAAPAVARRAGGLPELPRSMRVPVEKLDQLANLAPEMVLHSLNAFERHTELRRLAGDVSHLRDRVREARLMTASTGEDYGEQLRGYADELDAISRRMRDFIGKFSDDRVRLDLVTEELRQNVIGLTMQPVASVFDTFPRAVRDLARSFDKQVELTIRGRETELDKKLIEQIAEPLVHLVRNAVDHGLEATEDRVRAGKDPVGHLVLSAEQVGKRIHVALQDDGRGIDPQTLRAAAVRRGIASAETVAAWTDQELFELIFLPGFSTRSATTDVSGRGVGMDVVKSTVERMGGLVRLESVLGTGTTIMLDLPLSLALLRVVLLEAGGELFALPTAAVRRILHVDPHRVAQLQQSPVVEVDGETVPVATLTTLFRLPPAEVDGASTVLVAETGDRRFGLLVDTVHDEQEMVFRDLRGPLGRLGLFTAAALLGNGAIVPILDAAAVFHLSARSSSVETMPAAGRSARTRSARVLVVDDSLVAGELQKNILIAAGYTAEIAQDGEDALEALRAKDWDLVISDVDMPRMNGIELTTRLRADDHLREIPVIIVTSRDTVDDRRRGFEAGADAYVLKHEFDQERMLDTVQRLVGRGAVPRGPREPGAGRSHG